MMRDYAARLCDGTFIEYVSEGVWEEVIYRVGIKLEKCKEFNRAREK